MASKGKGAGFLEGTRTDISPEFKKALEDEIRRVSNEVYRKSGNADEKVNNSEAERKLVRSLFLTSGPFQWLRAQIEERLEGGGLNLEDAVEGQRQEIKSLNELLQERDARIARLLNALDDYSGRTTSKEIVEFQNAEIGALKEKLREREQRIVRLLEEIDKNQALLRAHTAARKAQPRVHTSSAEKNGQQANSSAANSAANKEASEASIDQSALGGRMEVLEKVVGELVGRHDRALEAIKKAHFKLVTDSKARGEEQAILVQRFEQIAKERDEVLLQHGSIVERVEAIEKLVRESNAKRDKDVAKVDVKAETVGGNLTEERAANKREQRAIFEQVEVEKRNRLELGAAVDARLHELENILGSSTAKDVLDSERFKARESTLWALAERMASLERSIYETGGEQPAQGGSSLPAFDEYLINLRAELNAQASDQGLRRGARTARTNRARELRPPRR